MDLLLQRISWEDLDQLNRRRTKVGAPCRKLTAGQLLAALLFHYTVSSAGSLSQHLSLLLGIQMAESSLSERRQVLPFKIFEELMRRLLRPVSNPMAQSFFKGWLMVGIDGVSFSLPNTDPVNSKCRKGANQKGVAAFAKLQCTALVELVMHNPLAARVGTQGQSEWALGLDVLKSLPEKCLLMGDRLYGCAAFLLAASKELQRVSGRFLVRVKECLTVVRELEELPDGSRWVEVKALEPGDTHKVAGTLRVREIRANIQRRGFRPVKMRLWTDLSYEEGTAEELVKLYSTRWEEELFFRELKSNLGVNDLLQSQTPETAAQEVAAMIIGMALIAGERAKLKPGEELAHRVSFIKTWEILEPLWLTLLLGKKILSEKQKQQMCEEFYKWAARHVIQKKRKRSYPRVLRQPVQPWPKKKNQIGAEGPLQISITSANV
jgi:hypothetical protein